MRFRIRTFLIVAAVLCLVMGPIARGRPWMWQVYELAASDPAFFLAASGYALTLLLVSMVPIVVAFTLVRKDDAYAARLRRNDVPTPCPWKPGDGTAGHFARRREGL